MMAAALMGNVARALVGQVSPAAATATGESLSTLGNDLAAPTTLGNCPRNLERNTGLSHAPNFVSNLQQFTLGCRER
jgi:hypothetical protein